MQTLSFDSGPDDWQLRARCGMRNKNNVLWISYGCRKALVHDVGIAESAVRLSAGVIAVPAGQMLLDSGFPKNDNTSL